MTVYASPVATLEAARAAALAGRPRATLEDERIRVQPLLAAPDRAFVSYLCTMVGGDYGASRESFLVDLELEGSRRPVDTDRALELARAYGLPVVRQDGLAPERAVTMTTAVWGSGPV
jgi:hypothetical protein